MNWFARCLRSLLSAGSAGFLFCSDPSSGAATLRWLADSVIAGRNRLECQPEPSAEAGVAMTCVFQSSDTLVTVASAGGDSVRVVTRVWPMMGQRTPSYATIKQSLQAVYGLGKETCPTSRLPSGRYWQAKGFYILLNLIEDSDSVYLSYILGQPKYEPGCPA